VESSLTSLKSISNFASSTECHSHSWINVFFVLLWWFAEI
jgi:hypothetical protein